MSKKIYDSYYIRNLDCILESDFPKDLKNKLLSVINKMVYCNNDFDKNFLDGIIMAVSLSEDRKELIRLFVENFKKKDLLKLKTMLYKYCNNFNIDSDKFNLHSILDSFFYYVFKDPNITIFKSVSDNLDIRKLFFLFQGVSEGKFQDLGYIDNLDDEKFYDVVSKYLNNINLDMLKYVLENDRTLSQFYFFVILDKLGFDLDMEYVKNVTEEVDELYKVYKEKYEYLFSPQVNKYLFCLSDSFFFFYYKYLYRKGVNSFFKEHVKRRFRLFLVYLVKIWNYKNFSKGFLFKNFRSFFDLLNYDMMYYKYSIYNNLEKFFKFLKLYFFLTTNNALLNRRIDSDEDRKLFLDYIFNDLFFDSEKTKIILEFFEKIGGLLCEDFKNTSLSKISKFLSVYGSDLNSFFIFLKDKYDYIKYYDYMDIYMNRVDLIPCLVSEFIDYMLSEYSKKRTLKFNIILFKRIFKYVIEKNIRCDYSLLFRNGKKSITMLKFYNSLN